MDSPEAIWVNSIPGGFIKRTSIGGIKFILTSIFEKRGVLGIDT